MKYSYDLPIDESKLQKTIAVSKAAFVAEETEQTLSSSEFLYQQSKYIKKVWWVAQAVLLFAVCLLLNQMEGALHIRRSLGIAAPLFVILILPELWKNRTHDAMEVEGTTFYTLRQVYAVTHPGKILKSALLYRIGNCSRFAYAHGVVRSFLSDSAEGHHGFVFLRNGCIRRFLIT